MLASKAAQCCPPAPSGGWGTDPARATGEAGLVPRGVPDLVEQVGEGAALPGGPQLVRAQAAGSPARSPGSSLLRPQLSPSLRLQATRTHCEDLATCSDERRFSGSSAGRAWFGSPRQPCQGRWQPRAAGSLPSGCESRGGGVGEEAGDARWARSRGGSSAGRLLCGVDQSHLFTCK